VPTTSNIVHMPNPRPTDTVVIDGSAIVGVMIRNVTLGFGSYTANYEVQLAMNGTRDGFQAFCADKTDLQNAVREMNSDERELCSGNGVNYAEIVIAYDALAVIGDAPVKGCISSSELAYLYTHANLTWDKVRKGLDKVPVKVFAPPAQTAAAQYFAEQVLNGNPQIRTADIQQLIANGGGIGYLPLAQAQKLGNRLTIIPIDSGSGCTAPSNATIWDRSYNFLSRPLYLYINRESLRRGEVFHFITYLLSVPGQARIADPGFVLLPSTAYQKLQSQIDQLYRTG
jgi:phosphate transport system substrate-binding protein